MASLTPGSAVRLSVFGCGMPGILAVQMRADSAITDPGYQDALGWLYGLSPNIRTAAQIVADHPRKLARMRALLDELGSPDRQFAAVLVAGTKGKGSVAAYSEAILRAAGVRTGLVTSPHLTSWCERTRISGQDVEPAMVARLLPTIRAAVERLGDTHADLGQPTTFEAGLAFALVAFAEQGVQIAVVEAGVGGLHDATNVLEPLAVALAPISYDHTATLGPTLTAITSEKTGVFRRGRLAVSAGQPPEAMIVVERAAREHGARLELLGRAWGWHPESDQAGCGSFEIAGPRGTFSGLTTPLLGRHQRENAAVAVALVSEVLSLVPVSGQMTMLPTSGPQAGAVVARLRDAPQGGARPSQTPTANPSLASDPGTLGHAVRTGLASVRWPGRLQVLHEHPWLVVDGAHNGDSAVRLAEAITECFGSARRHLILGTSVGKDVSRMLDALLPIAATVTLTRSHHERSVPLDDLATMLTARGVPTLVVPEVREAIAGALARATAEELVLVTGSLFVVGEALEAFGEGAPAGETTA